MAKAFPPEELAQRVFMLAVGGITVQIAVVAVLIFL